MNEFLDIRTLAFTTGLVYLVLTVNFYTAGFRKPSTQSLRYWTLSYFVSFLSFLLNSLQGHLPDLWTVVIANTAIVLGTIFIPRGLLAFSNDRQNNFLDILTAVSSFGLLILFSSFYPNVAARIIIMSLVTGLYAARSVYILNRNTERKYSFSSPLLKGSFYFIAVFALFRILYTLFMGGETGANFMHAGAVHAVTFLVLILGHIFISSGLLALSSRRIESHLNRAKDAIKKLEGLLPICAGCKKIRDDGGYWNQLEVYISEHSEAEFSHGLCPDCVEKYLKLPEDE